MIIIIFANQTSILVNSRQQIGNSEEKKFDDQSMRTKIQGNLKRLQISANSIAWSYLPSLTESINKVYCSIPAIFYNLNALQIAKQKN